MPGKFNDKAKVVKMRLVYKESGAEPTEKDDDARVFQVIQNPKVFGVYISSKTIENTKK